MRKWIDIVESTLGTLYSEGGEEAVGYWFHPSTGRHYTIAWGAAYDHPDANLHSDHADVVFDHPEWFGLDPEYLKNADDGDIARYGAVLKGWVRVGFNPLRGLRMDVRTPLDAARTLKWFMNHHRENIDQITVDIVSPESFTPYLIKGDDVAEYAASGRLQPAWRGQVYRVNIPVPESSNMALSERIVHRDRFAHNPDGRRTIVAENPSRAEWEANFPKGAAGVLLTDGRILVGDGSCISHTDLMDLAGVSYDREKYRLQIGPRKCFAELWIDDEITDNNPTPEEIHQEVARRYGGSIPEIEAEIMAALSRFIDGPEVKAIPMSYYQDALLDGDEAFRDSCWNA